MGRRGKAGLAARLGTHLVIVLYDNALW